jgi:hypothetical protein
MFSGDPDHNWASHDGDGFSYGCVIFSENMPKTEGLPVEYAAKGVNGRIVTAPLEVLWNETPRQKERY